MLSNDEIILILVTFGALMLMLRNRQPPDLIALGVLLFLGFSRLISTEEALAGFSSSVVITLMGLFIVTESLEQTGVVQWIARRINRIGAGSEVKLVLIFMGAGAFLSLVMNNIAAGAMMLPAAVQVAGLSRVKVSKLLMPLSFGTLVGGMATYLTTANIVLSGLLEQQGLEGLNMGSFIPTGGVIVLASLLYMLLIGRHLLPDRSSIVQDTIPTDFQKTYQLGERTWVVEILPQSRIAGKSLESSGIGEELGMTVLSMRHGQRWTNAPLPIHSLHVGDELVVLGREERLNQLLDWGVQLVEVQPKEQGNLDLVEVIIAPRSLAVGQTLSQLKFRAQYGLLAVALWREGRSYRTDVAKFTLQVGDALLVTGKAENIRKLARDKNYLVPHDAYTHSPLRPQKAFRALLITNVVLLIAIFDWLPLPEVMLAGAVALVWAGCLSMEEAYAAIEWRVIFLIAGMLSLSTAMANTGLAERIGTEFAHTLEGSSSLVFIAGMFLLAMLMTQVIGGQVAALVIGPVAITTALEAGISPQAMAVAVAIACSTAFLTPIAHPVNLLMMGVGGYRPADFLKVGAGMTLVTLVGLLLGMVVFWDMG